MAKQVAQGGLAKALGEEGRKALASVKNKETKLPGGGRLPAGIENGVAQLTKCYFAIYDKGDLKGNYYFRCEAVMVVPDVHQGVPVRGLHTSFMEPACNTPKAAGEKSRKTVEDHLEHIVNQMSLLGADRTQLADDASDLEATAKALQDAKPYFQVRTWKGQKQVLVKDNGKFYVQGEDGKNRKGPYLNEQAAKMANKYIGQEPRVNEVWGLAMPDFAPEGSTGMTDESGDTVPQDEGPPEEATEVAEETVEEATEGEVEVADGDGDEWHQLAVLADSGDKSATIKLTQKGKELELTPEQMKAADNWMEVAALIREALGGEGEAEGEEGEAEGEVEEAEWEPLADMVVKFKPLGKDKKPVKKAADVTILEVDSDAKTVKLKNLDDGKTIYKNIAWDRLIHD